MNGRIAVYRERLLPASETFIPAQVDAMQRWDAFYAGAVVDASGSSLLGERPRALLADHTDSVRAWRSAQRSMGRVHRGWLDRIRELAPDLVHAHFGPDAAWAMPLAKRLRIPLVATFHGWDFAICRGRMIADGGPTYPLYAARRPALFGMADRIIAVSNYAAEQLVRIGCPPEKIAIHPIGIDVDRFKVSTDEREREILFVGRLVGQKGTTYLFEAFERLRRRYPDWHVTIIGDGPDRARLEGIARDRALPVRFEGRLGPADVAARLARTSIFCVPSLERVCGCGESFGIAFAEAQASGVPVVSFAQGGIVEAVEDGLTGTLVAHRDTDALTDALDDLMSDEPRRVAMGLAGRSRIEHLYRISRRTAELEATYDDVVGARRSPNLTRT